VSSFDNFDEALVSFFEETQGATPMDAERYHDHALAFLCGAVAAMNVLSHKINESRHDKGKSAEQRITFALLKTNTMAVEAAAQEYARYVKSGKGNGN